MPDMTIRRRQRQMAYIGQCGPINTPTNAGTGNTSNGGAIDFLPET